jgi:hypothetical protein
MTQEELTANLQVVARLMTQVQHLDQREDAEIAFSKPREVALQCARFLDANVFAGQASSGDFLLIIYLFRRLYNDIWKVFAGVSSVRLGGGVETEPGLYSTIAAFCNSLGRFLETALNPPSGAVSEEAMAHYKDALVSYQAILVTCEKFLAKET